MRSFDTKIDNTAPASSGRLPAAQFNSLAVELDGLVTSTGLTPDAASGPDTDQTMASQAMARYAAGGGYGYQDTGSANAYVLTTPLSFVMPKSYYKYQWLFWVPGHSNTTASTVTANGVGSKKLLDHTGALLTSGVVVANIPICAYYDPSADSANGAFLVPPWANQKLAVTNTVINNLIAAYQPPFFSANGGSQSVANNTVTTLTSYSGTIINRLGDSTYSAGVITMGANDAGVWSISGHIQADSSNPVFALFVQIGVNGGQPTGATDSNGGTNTSMAVSVTYVAKFSAGDQISLLISHQNSGAATKTLNAGTLGMVRLGS